MVAAVAHVATARQWPLSIINKRRRTTDERPECVAAEDALRHPGQARPPAADNTERRRHLLPSCLPDPDREGLPRDHDFLPLDRAGNLKMESPRKPETPLQVGQGQGPDRPGGGGWGWDLQGRKVMTCAPIAVLAPAALPLLLPPSQAGPGVGGGRWGLRSPTCTRISVMCTYMCPAWATHVACVCLRSDACCVYTPPHAQDVACIPRTRPMSSTCVHGHARPGTSTLRVTRRRTCAGLCAQPSSLWAPWHTHGRAPTDTACWHARFTAFTHVSSV